MLQQVAVSQSLPLTSNERGLITKDEPKMSQLPSDTKHDVSLL